jgi:hypothetical protein
MTFKSIFNNEHMTKELEQLYKKANCINCPTEWFFPNIQKGRPSDKPGTNLFKAYSVCADCTVKKECFDFAVKYKCIGVWGGKLFSDSKRRNATKIKHTK